MTQPTFEYDLRWKAQRGYYELRPSFRWLSDEECDHWEELKRAHEESLALTVPKADYTLRRIFGLLNVFERRRLDKDDIESRVDMRRLMIEYGLPIGNEARIRVFKCPFHDDRMPSFSLDYTKKLWNCHAGCGGGDCFSFVMRMEDCTFIEALRILNQMF